MRKKIAKSEKKNVSKKAYTLYVIEIRLIF